jgi:hypothetical protein
MVRCQLINNGQKTPPLCHDRMATALHEFTPNTAKKGSRTITLSILCVCVVFFIQPTLIFFAFAFSCFVSL